MELKEKEKSFFERNDDFVKLFLFELIVRGLIENNNSDSSFESVNNEDNNNFYENFDNSFKIKN